MCQILIKSVAGIIMLWVEFFNNSKCPAFIVQKIYLQEKLTLNNSLANSLE